MIQYLFVDPGAEPLIRSLGIVSTALAPTPQRIPRSDRVTSTHGDMPARRRPAGMIPPHLLARPTAGRLAERVEATHLCKEWLSCLGRWPGTGGTSWRLYTLLHTDTRRLPLNFSESPSQLRHHATPIGFGARRRRCTGSSGSFTKQTARSCL